MELIWVIIIFYLIYRFASGSNGNAKNEANERRKEEERVKEQIRSGQLVRLTNGELIDPDLIFGHKKTLLPDFQYLAEHGSKYGYERFRLDYMDVSQLKGAANAIRKKIREEENEKRQIEQEKKWAEAEQQRIEKQRIEQTRNWQRLSRKIIFELDRTYPESRGRGVYVIHCTSNNGFYIGSSKNMLNRKSQHLSQLRTQKHHSFKLQKAFDEYGEANFKFYALQVIEEDDLFGLESYRDDKEIERVLKKKMKYEEQSFLNAYSPAFNIDDDTSARRHWGGDSRYGGGYRRY